MADFGLPDTTLAAIRQILADFPAVEKAVLYGSRAMGNYQPGSDIDLTLLGKQLNRDVLAKIATRLEESSIPYQVDLSLWDELDHAGLRDHIKRVGAVFYPQDDPEGVETRIEEACTSIVNCVNKTAPNASNPSTSARSTRRTN